MTCEDCMHVRRSKGIDRDFNVTDHWFCNKTSRNIYRKIEYSETYRMKHPSSPLSVVHYDHSKKPCKDHKVGGLPLDKWFLERD